MPALSVIMAAVLAAASPVTACAQGTESGEIFMPAFDKRLFTGPWRRNTEATCAARYPEVLRFQGDGVYEAPGAPEAGAYWHGGDWRIEADGRIFVQMANDAMVAYRVIAVSNTLMVLQDSGGCRIVYRRDR